MCSKTDLSLSGAFVLCLLFVRIYMLYPVKHEHKCHFPEFGVCPLSPLFPPTEVWALAAGGVVDQLGVTCAVEAEVREVSCEEREKL